MVFLLTIFFFTLILGFLVFIHELGHFMAAKASGIYVEEFAIGFGPIIFKRKIGDTLYRVNLLPLGGYVSLEGEESSKEESGFRNKSFQIKFFVLIAGVVMNLIVALILLGISLYQSNFTVLIQKFDDFTFTNVISQEEFVPIFLGTDITEPAWKSFEETNIIVGSEEHFFRTEDEFKEFLIENSGITTSLQTLDIDTLEVQTKEINLPDFPINTFAIELSVGDDSRSANQLEDREVVISINDERFDSIDEFLELLEKYEGQNVELVLLNRASNEFDEYTKTIEIYEEDDSGVRLGVGLSEYNGISYLSGFSGDRDTAYLVNYEQNPLSIFAYTLDTTLYQFKALGSIYGSAFDSGNFEEVGESTGGVVRVFDTTRELVSLGLFDQLITFTALISLSLAIFNILPFPALDGGQITVYGLEALLGKKIPDKYIEKINLAGFAFLMLLFVLVTINDLRQVDILGGLGNFVKNVLGR